MLQRINYLITQRRTFSIETTLATRSYRNLIIKAKEVGYRIVLLFFWLPSPEMAIKRVEQRVLSGGHNIPTEVIIRRYWMGIQNLFNIFVPIVDSWSLYDNSDVNKIIVEEGVVKDEGKLIEIKQACQKRKK